jgi:hypothetical protein
MKYMSVLMKEDIFGATNTVLLVETLTILK